MKYKPKLNQLKSVDKIKILWRCSEEKVKISLEVVKHEEG